MSARVEIEYPKEVVDVIESWKSNEDLYQECKRIKYELELIGWTCDYGLDGEIYDVKEI